MWRIINCVIKNMKNKYLSIYLVISIVLILGFLCLYLFILSFGMSTGSIYSEIPTEPILVVFGILTFIGIGLIIASTKFEKLKAEINYVWTGLLISSFIFSSSLTYSIWGPKDSDYYFNRCMEWNEIKDQRSGDSVCVFGRVYSILGEQGEILIYFRPEVDATRVEYLQPLHDSFFASINVGECWAFVGEVMYREKDGINFYSVIPTYHFPNKRELDQQECE